MYLCGCIFVNVLSEFVCECVCVHAYMYVLFCISKREQLLNYNQTKKPQTKRATTKPTLRPNKSQKIPKKIKNSKPKPA